MVPAKKTRLTMTDQHRKPALESRVRAVWRLTQRKNFSAGLLALCRWSVVLFLVGMTIDWLTFLPSFGRAVILGVIVMVSVYQAWRHGWRNFRCFDATRTALKIEKQQGGMESLLVTGIQLRQATRASGTSAALWEATQRKAEGVAQELEENKIVNFRSLRIPAFVATILTGLVLAFGVIDGAFLSAGLTRIFTPWSKVAYPTKTKLELRSGSLVIKEGDSAQILVGVSGVVPDKAMISVRTGEGRPREIELAVSGGSCNYTIGSASRDFSYRIKAGDARSDWHEVVVIKAPRIEQVQVKLEFPEYLERQSERVEALTLSVPQETKLHWELTLDRAIHKAVLNRDGMEPLPLQVSADGRQIVLEEEVDASRGYSFSWSEKEHGFKFSSPRYYLQVGSDQAPRVELTSPESNLIAMIGRPLILAARVQDDYGLGKSSVVYRVNQRDESLIELNPSLQSRQGEQPVDWDYRKTLPDLKIGDTVSMTLETSDRYPGENGPHIVRSETRRLTFLSREDYLEQIQKKKDRLLSRVQTAYRQQRAAFESVRSLEPEAEGYMQACQVEAIRQELVRDQLKGIARQLQALLDDLAVNNVSDAPEGDSLDQVRSTLVRVADTQLADAASLLRHQSGVAAGDSSESLDASSAAGAVNAAARELGSLVLLRSIDSAQEVYAREARMLAQVQASLRWQTASSESGKLQDSFSKEQEELSSWTQRLIADLQKGMRYEKRPLAVLRLIQSVKGLQAAGAAGKMQKAAVLMREGKVKEAEILQSELVTTLLDAEFSVRLSGAYSTLIKTRDQLRFLVSAQAILREQCADMTTQNFKESLAEVGQAQEKLRKSLLTMLLQTIPAPRTKLFDESWPSPPPVQNLLKEADRAIVNALKEIAAGEKDATLSQQGEAEKMLIHLADLVDRWSVELGLQTLGMSTLVAVTGERLALIEGYEAKVIALLEKTDIAAADQEKVESLTESQLLLAEELTVFNGDLVKQNQAQPDQDIPPLLSRMKQAEQALRRAAASLKANDADGAIGNQEQAADILAEAFELVTIQNEQLGFLQNLLMFQRSVGFAYGYMGDIVSEQRDMIAATKALKSDDISDLELQFEHLKRCMQDVAPLLDLVASRMDAGTPLVFAVADLEDAMVSLEGGDKLDALDAQDVAAESLGEVQVLVKAMRSQAGYIAEILEFLHRSAANLTTLEYQQKELSIKAKLGAQNKEGVLKAQQMELLAAADKEAEVLVSITGMDTFAEPAKLMRKTLATLTSTDLPAASGQMDLVAEVLKENAESLFAIITMLHGLPDIEILTFTDPDVQRLVDVLAVASAHKVLFRDTNDAKAEVMNELAERQNKLAERCQELFQVGEPHAMLEGASSQLLAAAMAMSSSDQNAIKRSQKDAMQTLRHFIIEQALILETAAPPVVAEDGDPDADGEGSDGESAFAAGFIADFVSGEAPKDQSTGWDVRGERNRAALNQNFARELPLEYRGLLKNYYERVAK